MNEWRTSIVRWSVLIWFAATSGALALERPRPGMMEAYRADGTLTQRLERARQFGNYRVRPDVARRTAWKMQKLTGGGGIGVAEVPPAWEGMATTGTNKVLIFLVDFPDAAAVTPAATVSNKVFGVGDPSEFPLESLRSYYQRSSYSNLFFTGSVLGWYRMTHPRTWYTTTYGEEGDLANAMIINEVATNYNSAVDYSQFDNNGDGKIDYFAVIWAGAHGAWASFWWGYQTSLHSTNITLDGVRFYDFSWQWETNEISPIFIADTIIHETGHALGLPDYYDYTPEGGDGPEGGVGGLDIMDGTYGDHNAFSKFMMEWLTPIVVTNARVGQILRATGQYPDAALVMNRYTNGTPFAEYFMVQNRYRVNNDAGGYMPGDGLLVWHVDARLSSDGQNFEYNNSKANHKLLRLMEADGLEEIESTYLGGYANAGDYYRAGATFSPFSTPSSARYDGTATDVVLDTISADGMSMTCNLSGIPLAMFSMAQPATVVSETSGVARLTVQRSQVTNSAITVAYYTSNGTAVAGTDYTSTNGALSFLSGQTTATVQVVILNDAIDQADQIFSVCLSNAVSGTMIGSPRQSVVTILSDPADDFTPPRLVQAVALGSNTVQIVFNEVVDPVSAEERTNYILSASVPTYAALASRMQVLLGVGGLTNGSYAVTVQNVKDAAGNRMPVPASTNFVWPEPTMALWLKLDDGSGTTALDSSGKGRSGILENGPTWTTGRFAGGINFDEINDRIRIADFAYGPELTVSFWFRGSDNSGTTFQYMLSHGAPQERNNVNVFITEDSQATPDLIRTSILDADDPIDVDTMKSLDVLLTGFPDDVWHLYTLTVKSNEGARVYLDGVFRVANAALGSGSFDPATYFYVGGRSDLDLERYFGGKLDDVRVYSRALSSFEVAALTNTRPSAVCSEPLVTAPYIQGESIPFSGTGTDPDGGACKLVWWSDTVGYLGTGASISNSTLPPGLPAVRLMAFDPFAARGETSCVVNVMADADTNGLPDTWATTYWPAGNSDGATNDYDHDGRNNFEEWLTGTNPTNDQSVFKIASMAVDPVRGIIFDWLGLTGRRYSVYTTTNMLLSFTAWTNNLRPVMDGIMSATNAVPGGEAQRFYRIQVGR